MADHEDAVPKQVCHNLIQMTNGKGKRMKCYGVACILSNEEYLAKDFRSSNAASYEYSLDAEMRASISQTRQKSAQGEPAPEGLDKNDSLLRVNQAFCVPVRQWGPGYQFTSKSSCTCHCDALQPPLLGGLEDKCFTDIVIQEPLLSMMSMT